MFHPLPKPILVILSLLALAAAGCDTTGAPEQPANPGRLTAETHSITRVMSADGSTRVAIELTNTGGTGITLTGVDSDADWLAVTPPEPVTLAANASTTLDLTLDATGLQPGDHQTDLVVHWRHDELPDEATPLTIPVTLTVRQAATTSLPAELVVDRLELTPTSSAGGQNVTVTFVIRNDGAGGAFPSQTEVRIARDPADPTPADALLARITTPTIAPGASERYRLNVTLPDGLPSGPYTVWVLADVDGTANQTDRTNDRAGALLTVQDEPTVEPPAAPGEPIEPEAPPVQPVDPSDPGESDRWVRYFGTQFDDFARSVAVDAAGNAYVTGSTEETFDEWEDDIQRSFLVKYAPDGTVLWTESLQVAFQDRAHDVTTDAAGNAFVTGDYWTFNGSGAFLAKYAPDGTLVWTQTFGQDGTVHARAVTTDAAGNAYVVGRTYGTLGDTRYGEADAYITKFTPDGTLEWVRQFGSTEHDLAESVATDDAGNLYVAGWTYGRLDAGASSDASVFLVKFSATGERTWTRQFGDSEYARAHGIALDAATHVYVTGRTGTPGNGSHAFLTRYTHDGELEWYHEYDYGSWDFTLALLPTTETPGRIVAAYSSDDRDVMLVEYDAAGLELSTQPVHRAEGLTVTGIATDANGTAYISGYSHDEGRGFGYHSFVVRQPR